MKPIFKFIISLLIPLSVGAVSGYFTTSSVNGWFTTIVKPSFNPPNWLFAPVWTFLYILMGIALFLVWNANADRPVKRTAITLFAIQMAFNFLWSFVFFYAHQPGWALLDIGLLWVFLFLTIIWFAKISKTAGWLLVPYICWVSFATVLNYAIWQLNE